MCRMSDYSFIIYPYSLKKKVGLIPSDLGKSNDGAQREL